MAGNFDTIKAAALASIESVLNRWAPGGKRQGHEYLVLNPTRSDNKPGSFSINLNTGAWADFATGDKGGDLVALVAYIESKKQGEAATLLADFLGLNLEKSDPHKRATTAQNVPGNAVAPATRKNPEWLPLLPVPDGMPPPLAVHPKHGKPSMRWEYRDADGGLLCLVYRFEPKAENERKQFCPLTWCESADGKRRAWRWQGLSDPRPLYHLDQLAARPGALVIVCEGEKAADAAGLLLPDAVAVTMLNGAQAPARTDWAPLAGREVWLWPDNDPPGLECMATVADLLGKAGAVEVRQINIAAFFAAGAVIPEKWDAADAVTDGWTAERLLELRATADFFRGVDTMTPTAPQTATDAAPADPDMQQHRRPYFTVNDEGVFYNGVKDGNWQPPWWICSKLEVTAVTRDSKGEAWGRLLEFDDLDGVPHSWACPMELFAGDGAEFRRVLFSMGLRMATATSARNLLLQYVQTAKVQDRARCVERTGWHGGVFVMPERTIGEADERILFQSAASAPNTFKQRSKLAGWQQHIAAPCAGNSRLVFAISTAFAAPLLHVTGMESGGLHYRGDSSTGKTTALRVAASVWGGLDYLQRWRATDNGLEALAAQHSDCLLVLDEISQVDPKAAGEVAYMLANGSGKARANRTGTMRDTASWRLLFLSSGEAGLAEHMAQANRKPKAGQEIRLLDIPADAGCGLGLFDTLHDHATGAIFSKALTEAAGKYYGTPSHAFLEKLVQHLDKLPELVKKGQREFLAKHLPVDAEGQANRAALRFALVGAAGEIATAWGITGWQLGEASDAAAICFSAWLGQRGGAGNQEQAAMLGQVRQFLELHGNARFEDWERATDDHAPKTVNRAGFRRTDAATDATEFYILREVFRGEVCKGFDYKVVCRVLDSLGCLVTEGKSYDRKERLPLMGNTRCYRINANIWGGEHE